MVYQGHHRTPLVSPWHTCQVSLWFLSFAFPEIMFIWSTLSSNISAEEEQKRHVKLYGTSNWVSFFTSLSCQTNPENLEMLFLTWAAWISQTSTRTKTKPKFCQQRQAVEPTTAYQHFIVARYLYQVQGLNLTMYYHAANLQGLVKDGWLTLNSISTPATVRKINI